MLQEPVEGRQKTIELEHMGCKGRLALHALHSRCGHMATNARQCVRFKYDPCVHAQVARGVEGVGLARAHLGSVAGELASGRASTAAVLLQEVLGLMDAPAVGTSTAAAAAQGSGRTATSAAAQSPRVGRAGGVATGAAAGSGRLALVAAAQGGSGLGASAHGMAGRLVHFMS